MQTRIFVPLRKVQRCMESLANPLTIPFGVHERQSKRCLNLHLMPRIAVRRHPIDRLLHPCSAFQKKRHGQEQLRGCCRQSHGCAVVSIGTKTPFKRGTDISKIIPQGIHWAFRGLQIEDIGPIVFQQLDREVCVPFRYGMMLAANNEFFQGVGTRRIEQSVERFPRVVRHSDQRLIGESSDRFHNLGLAYARFLRHFERRLQCEVSGENRDAPQHNPFDLRKVIVAPVQRCFERLMPRSCSSATELQQIKVRTQLCHSVSDAEVSGSSGGEFDGECNSVKLAANLGDNRGFVITE